MLILPRASLGIMREYDTPYDGRLEVTAGAWEDWGSTNEIVFSVTQFQTAILTGVDGTPAGTFVNGALR
ncbi:hypothetical protein ACFLX9_02775 [Chloroflexota bacterium]